jgi:hypothetical protein
MKYLLVLSLLALCRPANAQTMFKKNPDTLTVQFDDRGELLITPSETSSPRDFDFLQGNWRLEHERLKARLVNCKEWEKLVTYAIDSNGLEGVGNFDTDWGTFDGKTWEGRTIRLFNPTTRLWSLYWIDSRRGTMDPPVVGSFRGNIGYFFGKDVYKGKPVLVVFRWDKTDPRNPIWSQALSQDDGTTWEWNWYNVLRPTGPQK